MLFLVPQALAPPKPSSTSSLKHQFLLQKAVTAELPASCIKTWWLEIFIVVLAGGGGGFFVLLPITAKQNELLVTSLDYNKVADAGSLKKINSSAWRTT